MNFSAWMVNDMATKKRTDIEIEQAKTDRIMQIVAERGAYYRANPSRWIEEFIPGLKLRCYQKIILWAMAHNDMSYIVASRGLSKTYMMALYCLFKCVCYPGSHIVVCSYTLKQGKEVLLKITDDLMQRSSLVRSEISKVSIGQNDCSIYFKNKSWIRVVTATESSRGIRSTCICVDESRLVDQKIVDTVLRPMNSSPRHPGYLDKPEYSDPKFAEVPQEFYLSSAYYCQSEMFEKVKAYTANFLTPGMRYFSCDLPYQLSIKEGILLRETIMNEMSEATFNSVAFAMEREGLFWGSAQDALFDFNVINRQRVIKEALRPLEYYQTTNHRVPDKQKGEIRLLSVDIALMATRKHNNDASALIIHSAAPAAGNNYFDNIVYIETQEGLTTEELGLLVMRFYYQYKCDYIALDRNGAGLGVLDYIMADRYDPLYGQIYPALNVIDNPELAERCKIKNAPKVIYAIQATSKMNSDMALGLRSGFQNGYINLLANDTNIEDVLSKIRGYSGLPEAMQIKLRLPYVQTTFLVNELINLQHEVSNGLVKVKEKSGMRKDRYSSLEYGYSIIQDLSRKHRPKEDGNSLLDSMVIRAPKRFGHFGYRKGVANGNC